MAKGKKKVGRPTVMTDDVVRKLEYAFSRGLSDRQACLYADIMPSTLYKYCKENPEFSNRKELLKDQPKIKAKLIIADKLDEEDLDTAKWYLERKAKDEFSLKQDVSLDGNAVVRIIDDLPAGADPNE